jgi:hypothetical protein
VSCSERGGGKR